MESVKATVATATYTVFGETLRHVIPSHILCSYGCGGPACKYEDPSRWNDDEQAIRGLYSNWITDSVLAMARPSTQTMQKFGIIEQFQRCGLRTIINLQRPGEHAHCGNPLEPDSGFTYRPEVFMEAGIYFYNFGWNDFGVASLTQILDVVKVMCFALQEGKVAVHCHAGLGRSGVLVACFLVFTSQMTADQAILFVRSRRQNSIQTRGQLVCVRQFARFLTPLRNVFAHAEPGACPVTLNQFLKHQNQLLHGYEARQMRYVPKLVPLVCKLLLDIVENRQVIEEDILEVPDVTSDDESLDFKNTRLNPELSSHIVFGRVAFNLPRLPGPFTVSKNDSQQPLHYARKSLSYSDSDLRRLADMLNLSTNPLTVSPPHEPIDVTRRALSQICLPQNCTISRQDSSDTIWDLKTWVEQKGGDPVLRSRRQSILQRSQSLGVPGHMEKKRSVSMLLDWMSKVRNTSDSLKNKHTDEEEERLSEVPFITIQSELSLEARRLLVAHSLAVNLNRDGKEEHRLKVSSWQTDLNHHGAFERLCSERDPFVLAGILWSWIEQLQEPIISAKDVEILSQNPEPKMVLTSLDRAQRETLVCILDCFAHLLVIPDEVEDTFVARVIMAFTKMDNVMVNKKVYEILTPILKRLLTDMRRTALSELEAT